MCERSSQNGPWRFECSNFASKNVIYVVHVLVKRRKTFKNNTYACFQVEMKFLRVWSVSNQAFSAPHPTTFLIKLQQHECLREIWIIYQKKNLSKLQKSEEILEIRRKLKFSFSEFRKNRFDNFTKSFKSIQSI